ncbi:MAG TPA: molybdopterin-binding protein [Beijerinckiaceae bacterium]|nr:molybdopterin-binding protein [Beijerinckiaceae bacterium]
MKFGPVPVDESLGGIVAHAVRREGFVLRKGEVVQPAHVEALRRLGVDDIVVAQLEPGDVGEDAAARRLAEAVAGENVRVEQPFTGRSNLFAETGGVLVVDSALIDRINAIDEKVTLATLAPFKSVVAGEMIATVKIIPFAVPGTLLDHAIAVARDGRLRVAAFRPLRIGVISTLLPGLKPSVVDKTLRVMAERLAPTGAKIVADERVAHTISPLVEAIERVAPQSDLVIIFGASAITDRRDVIPTSIVAAGGVIEHFGMPVDPGNLLLVGRLGGTGEKIVLGAPGCARSPRENGFDWVLQRMIAGIPVSAADIRQMGAGGLLMEIISRPQPRLGVTSEHDD